MSLNKSKGNMYPWVTHTHAHLGGECPHKCSYCYVDNPRFGRPARYQGPIRLIDDEFRVKYGSGKTIFIEHMNDMFAEDIPEEYIMAILQHCWDYPDNTYVFQTKNPLRISRTWDYIPSNSIIGCTIETNCADIIEKISAAPSPIDRMLPMMFLPTKKFITIEPVLEFNVTGLLNMILAIKPDFVNIGADSKGHGLREPSWQKVQHLIEGIKDAGIEIREKHNLERLRTA